MSKTITPDIIATAHSILDDRMQALQSLSAALQGTLPARDHTFATDLIETFQHHHTLSHKQWDWVEKLVLRNTPLEHLYGSFDPIRVMFRMAADNGNLKRPKIRLISPEGRFVQLNFYPDSSVIKVFVDGWQGHGHRKFAGRIEGDKIIPWAKDRMTPDVCSVIQELALDPIGTAKAMAKLLHACMYCGSRLTDPPSKEAGYGPTCAKNYELPWGGRDNKKLDLAALFGSPAKPGPEPLTYTKPWAEGPGN